MTDSEQEVGGQPELVGADSSLQPDKSKLEPGGSLHSKHDLRSYSYQVLLHPAIPLTYPNMYISSHPGSCQADGDQCALPFMSIVLPGPPQHPEDAGSLSTEMGAESPCEAPKPL